MNISTIKYYLGIDVQLARGCSYFILNNQLKYVDCGWIHGDTHHEIANKLLKLLDILSSDEHEQIAIGIDAPRMPLKEPRNYYWDSKKNTWRPRAANEKGHGRHCEVIIKSLGIANPQWTPPYEECQGWMKLGFELFTALVSYPRVYEIFPSASYTMLDDDESLMITIPFSGFKPGPKDMLDACIASATVLEYINGRGCEIGGGDNLGSIILPRKVNNLSDILRTYPADEIT